MELVPAGRAALPDRAPAQRRHGAAAAALSAPRAAPAAGSAKHRAAAATARARDRRPAKPPRLGRRATAVRRSLERRTATTPAAAAATRAPSRGESARRDAEAPARPRAPQRRRRGAPAPRAARAAAAGATAPPAAAPRRARGLAGGVVQRRIGVDLRAVLPAARARGRAHRSISACCAAARCARPRSNQQLTDETVPAQRGTITDRNGVDLAVSEPAQDISADAVPDHGPARRRAAAGAAARASRRPAVLRKLSERTGFVYLARALPGRAGAGGARAEDPGHRAARR